jgi:pimeloyl-ACP methyl ester carboxylesterase
MSDPATHRTHAAQRALEGLPRARRAFIGLLGFAAAALATGCAAPPAPSTETRPPIVFVHGNGDSAALWMTTIWRFEANGWPRERLHAIDVPYPLARDDDAQPQDGRTSSAENRAFLAGEVDRALARSGAAKVVLIGNSRGGNAIRDYVAHGGAGKVSAAILGGTPSHGVWNDASFLPRSEFNGAGPFLTGLNAPQGPDGLEVTPGVRWLTVRSDRFDKYAQPDGVWLGRRNWPTHVTAEGPALRGAENVVIAGIDHRETSYGPQAFAVMWRFLTGSDPATREVAPEPRVVLDGVVSGLGLDNQRGNEPTNLPLVGATMEVYATDAAGSRRGAAVHAKTIGADGRWGPFGADPTVPYEFVITKPGYAITHVYRSPFPRSSNVVNFHAERIADEDRSVYAVVTLTRPRGYFGVPRDRIVLDGISPPSSIPVGVPGVASAKVRLAEPASRPLVGEFNGERIVGRTWPVAHDHLVTLELTY